MEIREFEWDDINIEYIYFFGFGIGV